jgi:hypothetical protein
MEHFDSAERLLGAVQEQNVRAETIHRPLYSGALDGIGQWLRTYLPALATASMDYRSLLRF